MPERSETAQSSCFRRTVLSLLMGGFLMHVGYANSCSRFGFLT